MSRIMVLLFAIPAVSIAFIALYEMLNEMFKKKFVLERRGAGADGRVRPPNARRRYSDAVLPETMSQSETPTAEPEKDLPAGQTYPM